MNSISMNSIKKHFIRDIEFLCRRKVYNFALKWMTFALK